MGRGLQLAGLSLRGRAGPGDVSAFIEAFTGSNRFVVDYLADEVLAQQPPEVREFLLRTSVLERLTGSLCAAVTGQPDSGALLDRLDRDNLFVVPLDHDRTWFRYHHLFADVLRARLMAGDPAVVDQLHRHASDWYANAGSLEDAIRHAFAGKDFNRAGRLVEQALAPTRQQRRDALLVTWLRALPDAVVRPNPVLSMSVGWAAMVAGDLDGLERHLDDADSALAAAAKDPTVAAAWVDTDDLRAAPAAVHMYRAALAQARGDSEGTAAHARAALALARREDHFIRAGGSGFLGLAAWARGDIAEALPTFEESVAALRAAGNHVDALDATIVLAGMWVTAGRPARARALCEQALATATAEGEPYPRATADLHTWLADLALARNDLAEADDELATAASLAERSSITENQHRWPTVAQASGPPEASTSRPYCCWAKQHTCTAPASTPTCDHWPPRRRVSSWPAETSTPPSGGRRAAASTWTTGRSSPGSTSTSPWCAPTSPCTAEAKRARQTRLRAVPGTRSWPRSKPCSCDSKPLPQQMADTAPSSRCSSYKRSPCTPAAMPPQPSRSSRRR